MAVTSPVGFSCQPKIVADDANKKDRFVCCMIHNITLRFKQSGSLPCSNVL